MINKKINEKLKNIKLSLIELDKLFEQELELDKVIDNKRIIIGKLYELRDFLQDIIDDYRMPK